jgi:hypothetical protein
MQTHTDSLSRLPDYALLALASSEQDINVVRQIVQELYLRLELRAYTDEEPPADENIDLPADGGIDLPADDRWTPRDQYDASLLRLFKENARK